MAVSRWFLAAFAAFWLANPNAQATADEVKIVSVESRQTGQGVWRFDVTVRHADTGWDHYADLWTIEDPDGNLLGERVLAHPHVEEQPFTRSLRGVAIPEGLEQVVIRPRDSVHGFGQPVLHSLKK